MRGENEGNGEQNSDRHQKHGWQQATGPPAVESHEIDFTALFQFPDEQAGDQITGNNKKDIDSDESTANSWETEVKCHHCKNSNGSQTLNIETELFSF